MKGRVCVCFFFKFIREQFIGNFTFKQVVRVHLFELSKIVSSIPI